MQAVVLMWFVDCLLFALFVHYAVWCFRSLIFYIGNGFDFTQECGSTMSYSDDYGDAIRISPKGKFFFFLPFCAVTTGAAAIVLLVWLLGVI
ncbi:hypothetical protein FHT76_007832 [Rhizobium sp. BK176]|nr:hypothetical protein [Rhizobium sp. BK176]